MADSGQGIRRPPQQARAQARMQRILDEAAALIAQKGSEQVKMSEIAERAGVPIGSVYQFFPDKTAIIRTLAEIYMARIREALIAGIADIASPAEALERMGSLFDDYYALFLSEPVLRDIWGGTQGDKLIQDLDIADSRENGQAVFDALKRFVGLPERPRFKTACFLVLHLTGAAVRMAIAVDRKEGKRLIEEFKQLMVRELGAFLKVPA